MAKIKLEVNGESARATVTDGILTHGAVGVQIDVSVSGSAWDGIPYKVICVCNGIARAALVIDGVATVPHECLIGGYKLQIGIDGSNDAGTIRIPSVLASCGTVAKSTANVQPGAPTPPTPDIYAQIMEAISAGKIRGDDGYSPTVGVMIIDGGHRITITDKAGMHSFDVLNGQLTQADREAIANLIPAYDDTDLKQGLTQKLTEPESMAVGQYFRIAAIDENGHAVLEAVDAPSGGVVDVKVGDVSAVRDNTVQIHPGGFRIIGNYLYLNCGSEQVISQYRNLNAQEYVALSVKSIDYAVKAAMTDGKGAAWTAEEQTAAQQRIGILSVEEVLF